MMTTDARRSWPHPIFMDLGGQPVVVIGGGKVAERKIETLLEAGARITVVSPEATDLIARRAAEGRIGLSLRPYRTGDLQGCRLAYAATSDPEVNQAVRREAADSGIWLNAVDLPDLCDFITPAIVRRGDLTIAVSTNGRCPALAREIREEIERQYGPEYAEEVERRGRLRDREKAGTGAVAAAAAPEAGTVYLVGAGPGDPELLTLKGRRLLAHADTVVYDALVDPTLLDLCPPSAARVYAGKRAGCHSKSQDEINGILIDAARSGHVVVRLKGGDPFMFGRGGEEAGALVAAGVRFEVVPGVSSGIAVPARAGIPLTHRGITGEVVFLSGHDSPTNPSPVDWARYAASTATLVIFMGLDNLAAIARQLLDHGRSADCPVAVIAHGTTAAQQVIVAPLPEIAETVAKAGMQAPALVVVGEVVGLRDRLQQIGHGCGDSGSVERP
jgi:uroporphyrin-III C-methyltransferase / precorrin-2 dehydrogenase / sirohydrochlorin ferrochelatase